MPTESTTLLNTPSIISGKILHKETSSGLPNLLVVLYDLDKSNDHDPVPNSSSVRTPAPSPEVVSIDISALNTTIDRLGSCITDNAGSFEFRISQGDHNPIATTEKKPDLLLVVLCPEEPGLDIQNRLLYLSKDVRINAGSTEAYIVKLNSQLLKEKGVAFPQDAEQPRMDALTKMEKGLQTNKTFIDRKKNIFKQHISVADEEYNKIRAEKFTTPFIDKISRVPASIRQSGLFVKAGQSVKGITDANVVKSLESFHVARENKRIVKGFIYLSDREKTDFEAQLDATGTFFQFNDDLAKSKILPKLFRTAETGSSNLFISDHPAARKCRKMEAQDQDAVLNEDDNSNAGNSDNENSTMSSADIPGYVATQLRTATAPEQQLTTDLPLISLEKKPSQEEISKNLNKSFEKGPADIPAYYEFHSLKIAFDHIWQEAIDAGLINNAEEWYNTSMANGEDPTKILNKPGDQIRREGAGISTTTVFMDNDLLVEDPTPGVVLEFPDALSIWRKLTVSERNVLTKISFMLLSKYSNVDSPNTKLADYLNAPENTSESIFYLEKEQVVTNDALAVINVMRQKGLAIIESAKERIDENQEQIDEWVSLRKANQLQNDLNNALKTNYSFKYYAANETERSINFGILLTYQQKWEPINYQVGELVKSMVFAPKETRKWSIEKIVKKHRMQKEQEENLRITKSESSDTARSETEIVDKANHKTTFDANSSFTGGVDVGPIKADNTTSFTFHNEAGRDSQQTKKEIREAVLKASQEYKNERKIEITTEETIESKYSESGEITNPNDELTVTYLFYELQRIFKISECLYGIRPVVMVAQEMPAPHDIDNEWIIRHDWILKRVLLDDSFRYGLECVQSIDGDEYMLDELEKTVRDQRKIVKALTQNVRFITEEVALQNRLLMSAIDKETGDSDNSNFLGKVPILGKALDIQEKAVDKVTSMLGMGGDGNDEKDSARVRREALQAAYERAERERKELLGRLERETGVLNSLVKDLAIKRREFIEKQTHVAKLKVHFKDNILLYMQTIWSYEFKDQRYFRLFDTKVPQFSGTYKINIEKSPVPERTLNDFAVVGKTRHAYTMEPNIEVSEATLKEVADLDTLIGYKGNYMIFPMNKSNILTDFMMAPYIDSEFALTDPDNLGNWTLEDYHKFVKCLRAEMGEDFNSIEDELIALYKQLLLDPLRNGDTVTVPTGSLFIEALPGSHTILENFKLLHRLVDVKKVQAEVRAAELENVRYAARILNRENEDPKIDKKIIVEAGASQVVIPSGE